MIEIIHTISPEIVIAREQGSEHFRPAAIGLKDDNSLKTRVEMEQREIDFQLKNSVATLAIAAHFTEQQAQQNAQNELLERVSLASWWVYRLPTTDSIDVPQIGDYQIVTGVAPSIGNGNATFTIIRNDSEFPFFTLGGGYAQDLSRAAEKSYLEAVQSWTATRWLRHNNMDFPNWDLNELSRRFNEIQAVTDSAREHIDLELMEPITPITVKSEDIFVSYFGAQRKDFSGRSRDYASLSRPARQPVVFTEHNF